MSSNIKGKNKTIEQFENIASSSQSHSQDSYDSDVESVTQEYLNSLLEKAKAAIAIKRETQQQETSQIVEEEIILDSDEQGLLPTLDPGFSPPHTFSKDSLTSSILANHADIENTGTAVPAPPPAPPELSKDGKPLTKRQRKELRRSTTGPDWFDLPAPPAAELPKLYHEVEALRLRNALDPKRFYRKEEGEGKGIKGLPKYFAIGTIIPGSTPFGTPNNDNLPRSKRKRTIVDELVDDAEAKQYVKKKFSDLQVVRGARGRNTLMRKKASRTPKW